MGSNREDSSYETAYNNSRNIITLLTVMEELSRIVSIIDNATHLQCHDLVKMSD